MGIFSLLYVFFLFVCFFDRGVKFCTRVRLLPVQVFSHFGELWLAWSHGAALHPG